MDEEEYEPQPAVAPDTYSFRSSSPYPDPPIEFAPVQRYVDSGKSELEQAKHKATSDTQANYKGEDRFELFLLGDGEKKVTEAADTRKL